jgi:hypothetical protein
MQLSDEAIPGRAESYGMMRASAEKASTALRGDSW